MSVASRIGVVAAAVGTLLLLSAAGAWADPAGPSNYRSTLVEVPDEVELRVQGGDSFLVLEVPPGTQVMVPGYDSDEDFSDWETLEQYLRVLPDGTVQLNRSSAAYYQNAERYGAAPEGPVGPDVPPSWETVADDGRVAWHDHRIHWMSPLPPDRISVDGGVQDVLDYRVPVIVDGELTVAVGDLDWVPDPSPVPVLLTALAGLVAAAALGRRSLRAGAALALVTGGVTTTVVVLAGLGQPVGFELATPPVALAAVGAVLPLLATTVPSVRDGQRQLLVGLGAAALLVFGVLATGLLDTLVAGDAVEGGYGNWWLRPTLPLDLAPGLLRYAIAAGTGVGAGLLGALAASALAVPGGLDGLDGLDDDAAAAQDA